ncbi:hypothetical protein C8R44DRAFT_890757 [Mycena epipterygia]|nr:hypothetical protein C8R44DRAFT_890757 [Mycena epipterygia]
MPRTRTTSPPFHASVCERHLPVALPPSPLSHVPSTPTAQQLDRSLATCPRCPHLPLFMLPPVRHAPRLLLLGIPRRNAALERSVRLKIHTSTAGPTSPTSSSSPAGDNERHPHSWTEEQRRHLPPPRPPRVFLRHITSPAGTTPSVLDSRKSSALATRSPCTGRRHIHVPTAGRRERALRRQRQRGEEALAELARKHADVIVGLRNEYGVSDVSARCPSRAHSVQPVAPAARARAYSSAAPVLRPASALRPQPVLLPPILPSPPSTTTGTPDLGACWRRSPPPFATRTGSAAYPSLTPARARLAYASSRLLRVSRTPIRALLLLLPLPSAAAYLPPLPPTAPAADLLSAAAYLPLAPACSAAHTPAASSSTASSPTPARALLAHSACAFLPASASERAADAPPDLRCLRYAGWGTRRISADYGRRAKAGPDGGAYRFRYSNTRQRKKRGWRKGASIIDGERARLRLHACASAARILLVLPPPAPRALSSCASHPIRSAFSASQIRIRACDTVDAPPWAGSTPGADRGAGRNGHVRVDEVQVEAGVETGSIEGGGSSDGGAGGQWKAAYDHRPPASLWAAMGRTWRRAYAGTSIRAEIRRLWA